MSEGRCERNPRCHRRDSGVPVEGTGRCALCGTAPCGYPVAPGGTESGVPRGAGRCTGSGVPVAPRGTGSGVPVAPGRARGRTPGGSWQSERSRSRRCREEPDSTHSSVRSCAAPGAATWAVGDRAGSPITAPQPGPAACAGNPHLWGLQGTESPHSGHHPGVPEQTGHGTGVGSSGAGGSLRAAPGTWRCEQGCAGSTGTRQWRQGVQAASPVQANPPLPTWGWQQPLRHYRAAGAGRDVGSVCHPRCHRLLSPARGPGARCQRLPPALAGSSFRAGHRQLPALPKEESANRARPWAARRLLRESVPSPWGDRAEGTPSAVSEWGREKVFKQPGPQDGSRLRICQDFHVGKENSHWQRQYSPGHVPSAASGPLGFIRGQEVAEGFTVSSEPTWICTNSTGTPAGVWGLVPSRGCQSWTYAGYF